jgi:ribosomal protein S18 acetylase RimI-like enzyme
VSGERLNYRSDETPEASLIAALYDAAGLKRPTKDLDRIQRMYQGSNIVLTCFAEGIGDDSVKLVGILRGWTDYAFDGYVCDLAVHSDYQHRGIGKELLERVKSIANPEVQWVLLASPVAKDYYAHLGWQKVENGWKWSRA